MTEPEPTPVTEDGEVIGPPPTPPRQDPPPSPPVVAPPENPPSVPDDVVDPADL